VRERDEHASPLAEHPRELGLGLGEPAGRDGGALRLEAVRLRVREGVERGRVVERQRVEPVFFPDALDVLRLPHEVGRAADGWNEVVRRRARVLVEPRLGRELRLHKLSPALDRGVDHRLVDRMQRALRERRERANLLDLVAEELHAKRLAPGARKDVDEPAAHRHLAAFLHTVDTLVAGERECLDECVEPDLVSDGDPDRRRPLVLRGQAFSKSSCGGGDEAAGREHVERAGALSDEVRRRLEPGADRDATAREKRDLGRIDVPRQGLGGVASLLVLGQNGEQRAVARLVQRGEDEGKRRVGHARRGREVLHECAKCLALGERGDEGIQR
jgi:hypothetical protein